MDKKILEISKAINFAKGKEKQGKFDEADEIYKNLINKKNKDKLKD